MFVNTRVVDQRLSHRHQKLMGRAVLFVLLLAAAAQAAVLRNGYRSVRPVADNEDVAFTIHMTPVDGSALERTLMDISNPRHERFRQYLTHAQVSDLVAPSPSHLANVHAWVAKHFPGAEMSLSQHNDLMKVRTRAGLAAKAFGVTLALFEHNEHPAFTIVRAKETGLAPDTIVPVELADSVKSIFSIVDIVPLTRSLAAKTEGVQGDPGVQVDPLVIFKQYNLTANDVGGSSSENAQGVAAFEQAEFRPADVAAFQKAYKLPPVKIVVDGPNSGGYFGEASLDTQYITASGRGVKSYFIAQDDFDMLSWCELVLKMKPIPKVLSISWGSGESAYSNATVTSATACFQKLGTMGVSIFAASGDQGTNKQGFWGCKKFDPTWPASCPFVTAVGGTYINTSSVENGWSLSGGGFSALFGRPSYQDNHVATYFDRAKGQLPKAALYNPNGRAIPDISAVATNFKVCSGGCGPDAGTLTGTSASTPTVAGMVSVINDMLAAEGKPPVGFINPLLYAASRDGAVGFDVLTGNNKYGGCPAGFEATAGWDPVTGVGTPLFSMLKTLLMN